MNKLLATSLIAASFTMLAACGGSGGNGGHVPAAGLAQSSSTLSASPFTVTSTTFTNLGRIPTIMVANLFGCTGGNQSPQLSWRNAPAGTRAFAIVMFDQTANFAHWGMYNISSATTNLPQNASAQGNTFGIQTNNDFPIRGYGGPCPPPGLNHRYVITVYALDGDLYVSSSPMFPSNVEGLMWTMQQRVLGKATITGIYSS